jgi:hypothetical protein
MANINLPSSKELLKLLNEEQFLQAILAQLNKDLGSMYEGITLDPDKPVVEHLSAKLRRHLIGLDRVAGNRLQDLMYRVDVPANTFFDVMNNRDIEDPYLELSHVILNREMKKVWFRMNYTP